MSFHENTPELVLGVCMLEYSHAIENWGETYNSLHEGWAVLKEEFDEVHYEISSATTRFDCMWNKVKLSQVDEQFITIIQNHAINAMKELAQVWAVCEKIKEGVQE